MAWFDDLSPCDYFGDAPGLLAVGWLEAGYAYARGPVSRRCRERLEELLAAAWQGSISLGVYRCQLCPPLRDGEPFIGGYRNLFVPGDGVVYAAPELVRHYINDHAYAPPRVFQQAVIDCPGMGSPEYFRALLANGPRTGRWRRAAERAARDAERQPG